MLFFVLLVACCSHALVSSPQGNRATKTMLQINCDKTRYLAPLQLNRILFVADEVRAVEGGRRGLAILFLEVQRINTAC